VAYPEASYSNNQIQRDRKKQFWKPEKEIRILPDLEQFLTSSIKALKKDNQKFKAEMPDPELPSKPLQDKSDEEIPRSTKIYKTRSSKTYQEGRPNLETSRTSRSTSTEMAKPTKPKRKKPISKPVHTKNVEKKDRELSELPTKDP
ncbi:24121_t:CDS:2, partial [Gigaspora margarita]